MTGLIIRHIELQRVGSLIASMEVQFYVITVALVTLERGLFAYKWKILLACKGINIPFWSMLKLYYISNFLGTFVPSTISVDVIRAYQLRKHTGNLVESVSSVVVDKVLSLLALLVLPLTSAVAYVRMGGDLRIILLLASLLVGFLVCLGIASNRAIVDRLLRVGMTFSPRLADWFKVLHHSVLAYMAYKRTLSLIFVLSVIIQLSRVLGIVALGLGLGQQISMANYFIFVPIINLLVIIPMSVAGIGIQEGSFIYFFSQVDMLPSVAFTISILSSLVVLFSVLPGGVFYLLQDVGVNDTSSAARNPAVDGAPSKILQ